jgi:cation transport protein ChaC
MSENDNPSDNTSGDNTPGDIWVFGYGSLIWDPKFPVVESRTAVLHGYRRSLCILSIRNRGTAECPGLVVGLERGGSCVGRAHRVAAEHVEDTIAYLHERELATHSYIPKKLPISLQSGERIKAVTFVARVKHPQYAGGLSETRQAELIVQGHGPYGTSLDYLRNVIRHLDECGIASGPLHRVLAIAEDMASQKTEDPT